MKKRLLLHVCCGPCSIAIFEELLEQFDLVVHFYNPNIHPETEYYKRKKEVIQLCKELNIPVAEEEYDVKKWFQSVEGLEQEPEGGKRCIECFKMRLEKAAQYAKENNFEYFCTSLTSGRNKKASIINPIGLEVSKKYGLIFLEEDWKKKGRQEKATKMISEKNIYRQDYCGCTYSKISKNNN
jgi:predicted adenine nucleotide alpha hydrolase (AANH) superfamily ATPase